MIIKKNFNLNLKNSKIFFPFKNYSYSKFTLPTKSNYQFIFYFFFFILFIFIISLLTLYVYFFSSNKVSYTVLHKTNYNNKDKYTKKLLIKLKNNLNVLIKQNENISYSEAILKFNVGLRMSEEYKGFSYIIYNLLKEKINKEFINEIYKYNGEFNSYINEYYTIFKFKIINEKFFYILEKFSNIFLINNFNELLSKNNLNNLLSKFFNNLKNNNNREKILIEYLIYNETFLYDDLNENYYNKILLKNFNVINTIINNYFKNQYSNNKNINDNHYNLFKIFFEKYYTTNNMKLIILSKYKLSLQKHYVIKYFLKFNASTELNYYSYLKLKNYNQQILLEKNITLNSINNKTYIKIFYYLNNKYDKIYENYDNLKVISYILNRKVKDSLYVYLKNKYFIKDLKSNVDICLFNKLRLEIKIEFFKNNIDNMNNISKIVYNYIRDLILQIKDVYNTYKEFHYNINNIYNKFDENNEEYYFFDNDDNFIYGKVYNDSNNEKNIKKNFEKLIYFLTDLSEKNSILLYIIPFYNSNNKLFNINYNICQINNHLINENYMKTIIFNFSNIQPNIFISNLTKPINKKTKKTKINTFQKISIDDPQNVTIFYLYTDFSFPKIKIIFNIYHLFYSCKYFKYKLFFLIYYMKLKHNILEQLNDNILIGNEVNIKFDKNKIQIYISIYSDKLKQTLKILENNIYNKEIIELSELKFYFNLLKLEFEKFNKNFSKTKEYLQNYIKENNNYILFNITDIDEYEMKYFITKYNVFFISILNTNCLFYGDINYSYAKILYDKFFKNRFSFYKFNMISRILINSNQLEKKFFTFKQYLNTYLNSNNLYKIKPYTVLKLYKMKGLISIYFFLNYYNNKNYILSYLLLIMFKMYFYELNKKINFSINLEIIDNYIFINFNNKFLDSNNFEINIDNYFYLFYNNIEFFNNIENDGIYNNFYYIKKIFIMKNKNNNIINLTKYNFNKIEFIDYNYLNKLTLENIKLYFKEQIINNLKKIVIKDDSSIKSIEECYFLNKTYYTIPININ